MSLLVCRPAFGRPPSTSKTLVPFPKNWCHFWFVGLPSAGLLPPQKLQSLFVCRLAFGQPPLSPKFGTPSQVYFVGLPSAGLLPPQKLQSLFVCWLAFGQPPPSPFFVHRLKFILSFLVKSLCEPHLQPPPPARLVRFAQKNM